MSLGLSGFWLGAGKWPEEEEKEERQGEQRRGAVNEKRKASKGLCSKAGQQLLRQNTNGNGPA